VAWGLLAVAVLLLWAGNLARTSALNLPGAFLAVVAAALGL